MKKVLAIYGDGFHCALPLHASIGAALEKQGFVVDAVADLDIPYDRFSGYDLIVISRYGRDDAHFLRTKEERLWLTEANAKKLEDYVSGGGKLFLHHDAFALYPEGHVMCKLAKAVFITHPPIGSMTVTPVLSDHPLTRGVSEIALKDEEYVLTFDPEKSTVFAEGHSEEQGRSIQGWHHTYGKGEVVVFIPGHNSEVLFNPTVAQYFDNIIRYMDDSEPRTCG
jgi:type 1 glutamine amidotransferase